MAATPTRRPRLLVVETGFVAPPANEDPYRVVLDYKAVAHLPGWLRALESRLKLDFGLALAARRRAANFDLVWASSEKVGIPLALLGLSKPLMVTVHSWNEPKQSLVRWLRLYKRWAAVGYITDDHHALLRERYQFPEQRLFRAFSVRVDVFTPGAPQPGGAILSLGAAKRDYRTLLEALRALPGCETRISAASKYGDLPAGLPDGPLPDWVRMVAPQPDAAMPEFYRQARFVVLPLLATAHSGAGMSVALEASASGKAVIATRTSGTASFVKDGETGLLVPPGDAAALRQAIAYLCDHPEAAERMGQAGRRWMETSFAFFPNVRKIERLMEEIAFE